MADGSTTHKRHKHQTTTSQHKIRHETTKAHHATQKHGQNMLPNPKTNTPTAPDPQHTKQTQTQISEVLKLSDPSKLEDIPALCNKAIATIINKANCKLVDSLRKKEDQLY